jgi:hypothetical protein
MQKLGRKCAAGRKGIVQNAPRLNGVIRREWYSSCAGRSASKTRVNALMTRASIFFAKGSYEDGWIAGSSPAMTGRMDPCPQSMCPVELLRTFGTQPPGARIGHRRRFPVSGLLFTGNGATSTCRAVEGRCGTISRHDPS